MKKSSKATYSKYAIASAISALFFIVLGYYGTPPYLNLLFSSCTCAIQTVTEVLLVELSLLAVIFGIIAIIDIRKNKCKGLWLAIAGIIISIMGLSWFLLLKVLQRIGTV